MLLSGGLPAEYLDDLEAHLVAYQNASSDPAGERPVRYDPLVRIGPGLSLAELKRAEDAFEASFPEDYTSLLLRLTITGEPWDDWIEPELMRERALSWINAAAAFDIRENGYWHSGWGSKPDDLVEAIATAEIHLGQAPPLLPILGHRFIPASPCEPGNPVISMYQFVDSIYYGNDLADYFHRELGVVRPDWARSSPREVPFWSSIVE